jgi:RNA polymerase sigma factor (sigma-70 family)
MSNHLLHSWVKTAWSKILLGRGNGDAALQARNDLLVRYHEVVLRYFLTKLRDEHAARELYSNFAVRLLETDALVKRADPDRGPFRYYLKQALHNMVRDYFRGGRTGPLPLTDDVPGPDTSEDDFRREWRQELINQAWRALEELDRAGQSQHYVVLRFHSDHPHLRAGQMVEQLGAKLGKPMTTDGVRQARHRARERFGALLLAEVERSLRSPTHDELEQELIDLRLLEHCKKALSERLRR